MPSKSNLTAALAVLLLAAACEKGPLPGLSSDRLGVVRCPGDDSLQRRRVNTSPEDGYRDRIDSSDFREWQYRVTEGGIVSEPVAETTPVEIPATYIRHITILDPSEGNEDNFSFEYDHEGRVTTISGNCWIDDEYSMYYYSISYEERSVSITGDDGICIEATLDSEGRATEVKYSETGDGREYVSDITLIQKA